MAVRTIAPGGGNWNATATWLEGVVPALGDNVFAVGTSGQLTVNVTAACTSIDFTNYTNTLTMNATLSVGGNVTLVAAMTVTGTGTLSITAAATLINMDKIAWNTVTVTAGTTLTMNKFFSGSPKQKTTIQSSVAGTAYTITFQDTFEKIAKFVKVSDCSLTRKGQLLMLTPNSDKGGNSGIRYINQSPNGIAKNAPSVVDTMTSPALGFAADPCFISL